jgi:hypothetical protein
MLENIGHYMTLLEGCMKMLTNYLTCTFRVMGSASVCPVNLIFACSQEISTGPYHEPDEYSPSPHMHSVS